MSCPREEWEATFGPKDRCHISVQQTHWREEPFVAIEKRSPIARLDNLTVHHNWKEPLMQRRQRGGLQRTNGGNDGAARLRQQGSSGKVGACHRVVRWHAAED